MCLIVILIFKMLIVEFKLYWLPLHTIYFIFLIVILIFNFRYFYEFK